MEAQKHLEPNFSNAFRELYVLINDKCKFTEKWTNEDLNSISETPTFDEDFKQFVDEKKKVDLNDWFLAQSSPTT